LRGKAFRVRFPGFSRRRRLANDIVNVHSSREGVVGGDDLAVVSMK
jgi:hypothetical protein